MSQMLDDPRTLDDTKLIELGRHTSEREVAANGAIKSRDMKGGDGERQLTEDDKHFVPSPRDGGKGRTGRDKFGNTSGFKKGRRGRKG